MFFSLIQGALNVWWCTKQCSLCVCECSEREEDLEWGGGGGGLESQVSIV